MRKNGHEEFGWDALVIDKPFMDRRLTGACRTVFFGLLVQGIVDRTWNMEGLRYVEVGCGTGTMGLIAAMLGADVTLMDIDEQALSAARRAFALYGCKATFVKADVMGEVPDCLRGKFDVAVSGGLVEHFTGEDRVRVMAYHRKLLGENGFAMISAPNRLSPFYWAVRTISTMSGQWDIDTEIPFTGREMVRNGAAAGFRRSTAAGSAPLRKDALVYGFAVIALLLRLLPGRLRAGIARSRLHSRIKKAESGDVTGAKDIAGYIRASFAAAAEQAKKAPHRKGQGNRFSSGVIYLGE